MLCLRAKLNSLATKIKQFILYFYLHIQLNKYYN